MWTAAAGASAIIGCKKGSESDAKYSGERRRRILDVDFGSATTGGLDDIMHRDRSDYRVQNRLRRGSRLYCR